MSVTMGNAIRQLKLEISGSDIDMIEQDVRPTSVPVRSYIHIDESRQRMHCVTKLITTSGIGLLLRMKSFKNLQARKLMTAMSFSLMQG